MKGINNLVKMAQQAQSKILKLQEELSDRVTEASAGGGMVVAAVNGRQQLLSLTIAPDVLAEKDVEMLQDLILAAVNEALKKSQEMMTAEMQKITGGLNLPGLL
jgi:DNA-binding YbaB/EbfC family protein